MHADLIPHAIESAESNESDRVEDAFVHAALKAARITYGSGDGELWWRFAARHLAAYCAELWMTLTPAQREAFGPRQIGEDMRQAMEDRWDAFERERRL